MSYLRKSIGAILRAENTVFTVPEIAIRWGDSDVMTVKSAINYYVRTGQLYRIRNGIYAKDKNFNPLELATRIFTPSYVSFETVLLRSGMVFQYTSEVTVATYLSRKLTINDQRYTFRRIQGALLTDMSGITHERGVSIASPERAYLDMLYLHKSYYFDNLRPLNWNKVLRILPIYNNRRMEKVVAKQYKQYALQTGST